MHNTNVVNNDLNLCISTICEKLYKHTGYWSQSFPHLFCCQGASDRVHSLEQTYVRKTENSKLNKIICRKCFGVTRPGTRVQLELG